MVGLHLKSLRPGLDATGSLLMMEEILAQSRWMRLRVDLNREETARANTKHSRVFELLKSMNAHPRIDIRIHDRFTDAQLWAYLRHVDVSVLPYRLGTHSGWAEACLDLGTAAIAPGSTCIPDQHASIRAYDISDAASLRHAFLDVFHDFRPIRNIAQWRSNQREAIALLHENVYSHSLETV